MPSGAIRRTLVGSMQGLFTGVVLGALGGLLIAAIIARMAYRRMAVLHRRAQQNARLAELGTLTGGLAHEIKNPLSTIQLNLQLLLEDIRPDDPLYGRFAHRISTVQREASRLKEILEDFLRFAGKMELQVQRVELNGLLEELVDFFTPQAQMQRIQLRLRQHTEAVYAEVDPRLLKQAVLNLLLNGMQALADAPGELIVSLSATPTSAIIEVIDTGKGMSREIQDRLFQAYFSLRKGGTGLGLAMAKRIVDEHHGKISVVSQEGKGSDFRIELPLIRA